MHDREEEFERTKVRPRNTCNNAVYSKRSRSVRPVRSQRFGSRRSPAISGSLDDAPSSVSVVPVVACCALVAARAREPITIDRCNRSRLGFPRLGKRGHYSLRRAGSQLIRNYVFAITQLDPSRIRAPLRIGLNRTGSDRIGQRARDRILETIGGALVSLKEMAWRPHIGCLRAVCQAALASLFSPTLLSPRYSIIPLPSSRVSFLPSPVIHSFLLPPFSEMSESRSFQSSEFCTKTRNFEKLISYMEFNFFTKHVHYKK